VIRRIAGDTGALAIRLLATLNPTARCSGSPPTALAGAWDARSTTREWAGALNVSDLADASGSGSPAGGAVAATAGGKFLARRMLPTSRASCAIRMLALATRTSPSWDHAEAISSSWRCWITCVPNCAGTRNRGSRLSRCTQPRSSPAGTGLPLSSMSSCGVSACQRP